MDDEDDFFEDEREDRERYEEANQWRHHESLSAAERNPSLCNR